MLAGFAPVLHFGKGLFGDRHQLRFFLGSKTAEDEFDITELPTDLGIVGAETNASKIFGMEVGGDGFEAIVAAAGAASTEAGLSKIEVKIVANYK